jgi:hypothetical protein
MSLQDDFKAVKYAVMKIARDVLSGSKEAIARHVQPMSSRPPQSAAVERSHLVLYRKD